LGWAAQLGFQESIMRQFQSMAVLAMGAMMLPAVLCRAQSNAPALPTQTTHGAPEEAAPAIPVEDQATVEQVERLFQVMRIRQQTESLMKQMSMMMQQQVAQGMKQGGADTPDGKKLAPEQLAERQKLMEKLMDRAMHVYTVDEMLADMTPIYQRHISKSDIEAFIAFFGSSSGQHFLDQQPLIAKEYMPLVMTRVQEKTKALTDEMKKDIDELNSRQSADPDSTKQ
jgi:hypothetical protein